MKADGVVANHKLEAAQDAFQKGFNLAVDISSLNAIANKLDLLDKEFLSIAYEGASMNIALNCLETSAGLKPWFHFLASSAKPHNIQYHIGLGWALAQLQLDAVPYMLQLGPIDRYRVPDGYGYYDAIFRTKRSIHNQQKLEEFNKAGSSAYYQGIGRGIWYLSLGRKDEAKNLIDKFAEERHADLWRGLGIACSYAGGCDELALKEIMILAGDYKPHLATGAVMVAICRENAGFMSADTELACKIWCKQSAAVLASAHKPDDISLKANEESAYLNWIWSIESSF